MEKNIASKLSCYLQTPLFQEVIRLAKFFNVKIYLVGGPVRDILLARRRKNSAIDFDFALSDKIKKFGQELAQRLSQKFIYYPQFLTGKISLKNQGKDIDLAQLRSEIYERPAQLPKVFKGDIFSDLKRRDFTINAIAYDLIENKIIDPFSGILDLKRGIIRALHEKSFIDDPTRIFRAVRFEKRFNFSLEKNTLNWLKKAIKENYLNLLSGERILQELRLITKEENLSAILKRLQSLRVFKTLFNVNLTDGQLEKIDQLKKKNLESSLIFNYLLFLLQAERMTNLPLKRNERETIEGLKKFLKILKRLKKASCPSSVFLLLKNFSSDVLRIAQKLYLEVSGKIEKHQNLYSKIKPILSGDKIKDLEKRRVIKPVPLKEYGKILLKLRLAKIDGKLKTEEDEIRYLKRCLR